MEKEKHLHKDVAALIVKRLQAGLTEEESAQLEAWAATSPERAELVRELTEAHLGNELSRLPVIRRNILDKVYKEAPELDRPRKAAMLPIRWAAAAAVIFTIGAGLYYFAGNRNNAGPRTEAAQHTIPRDTAAATSAYVTLANGDRIFLDSMNNGQTAAKATIRAVKQLNGQLVYEDAGEAGGINTLTIPRGHKPVQMRLSDGTSVWLNASSTLTYPVPFTGKERLVQVSGEAYLEVAADPQRPFRVQSAGWDALVLGTAFNVHAYPGEGIPKITLLEGAIRVEKGPESQLLRPGQQAQVGERLRVTQSVDLEAVLAWKNGLMYLSGADIRMLMREISRNYNVDVVFKKEPENGTFGGYISRNVSLLRLVQALQEYGVSCRLEGARLIIE